MVMGVLYGNFYFYKGEGEGKRDEENRKSSGFEFKG